MTSEHPAATPVAWHALSVDDVVAALRTDPVQGLTGPDVAERLTRCGANRLPEAPRRPAWRRFLLQFHNPLIYVLLVAGGATLALQDHVDAAVILGVVLVNAMIGFVQEGKAERALEAVRSMLAAHALVLRDGERRAIDAGELVPGDIVCLASGDRVPADLRVLRAKGLRVNEAALTGESVPVDKTAEAQAASAPLADRHGMLHAGTLVAQGQAVAAVVATGERTEIGRIGSLVREVVTLATPLTRRLDQFARQITILILVIGAATFAYGYLVAGLAPLEVFLAVVGLAVAAIPEGLPAVVTIVLALGTRAMAHDRAVVRRLPAVETLGSVSVICTDKTGTLTCNEMSAVRLVLMDRTLRVTGTGYAPEGAVHQGERVLDAADDPALDHLVRCGLLCNDARLEGGADEGWRVIGDPTEGALLVLARRAGLDSPGVEAACPRLDAIPFESEHRYMATLHHDHDGRAFVLLKGAPERVLALCTVQADGTPLDEALWQRRIDESARAGERVLALARCEVDPGQVSLSHADIHRRFTLLGLVGLIDPPRPEARAAVARCQEAGIRVKMITGDHAVTAAAIGKALGLQADRALTGDEIDAMDDAMLQSRASEVDVFARASPEHKLRLISALQAQGQFVAMTGDGVNDAPALKAADIGVAMGLKGTDAAREAADVVLTDDHFATIAHAVHQGRVVFDNIKKSLLFMMPTNFGEAGVIVLAIFAGLALPVTAGQILWVNTVTAVTLALALAFEPGEPGVMSRPPRLARAPLIGGALAFRMAYVSALMVAVTFAVFEWSLASGHSLEQARTAAVNMLALGEMVYLFNVRHFTAPAWGREVLLGNRVAFAVSVVLVGLQLAFTYLPPMQAVFQTAPLDLATWAVIVALAVAKFLAVEAEKAVWRARGVTTM